jgi:hypothetical protein
VYDSRNDQRSRQWPRPIRTSHIGPTTLFYFLVTSISNEALPQTDEVYGEDGALIAIANDRWTPIEPAGTMP